MAPRLSAATALLLLAGACGAPSPPATLYTVTSVVMQRPGELPRACFATPLPYPPIGCGGPDVEGIDLSLIPRGTVYTNGVRATGMLRLVGNWDGRGLSLSEPPQPAAMQDATRMPECTQKPGTSSADPIPPVMERVNEDKPLLRSNGILLLEFYPCNGTVFLGLAVADQKAVDFLTKRYGRVEIAGWLQRVR